MPAYVVWLTYICHGFVLHKFSVPRPRQNAHCHTPNSPRTHWKQRGSFVLTANFYLLPFHIMRQFCSLFYASFHLLLFHLISQRQRKWKIRCCKLVTVLVLVSLLMQHFVFARDKSRTDPRYWTHMQMAAAQVIMRINNSDCWPNRLQRATSSNAQDWPNGRLWCLVGIFPSQLQGYPADVPSVAPTPHAPSHNQQAWLMHKHNHCPFRIDVACNSCSLTTLRFAMVHAF